MFGYRSFGTLDRLLLVTAHERPVGCHRSRQRHPADSRTMKNATETLTARVSSNNDPLAADQVLYRFLVDSLTEYAVFAVSPSGVVISWNAGAEKTFGYTQAEILGRPFDFIF